MKMYKQGRVRGPIVSHNENYVTFISKPPKPPSWRDFLPDARDKSPKSSSVDFTDLSLVQRTNTSDPAEVLNSAKFESSVNANVGGVVSGGRATQSNPTLSTTFSGPPERASHKQRRKPKARIHRTRSHMTISDSDLPAEVPTGNMAVSLANSKPREFGLKKKNAFDGRVYLDDNNRRCQRWLASLEPCEPLEDVAFAQGAGVELVIPEETWSGSRHSPTDRVRDTSSESESENIDDKITSLPAHTYTVVERLSPSDVTETDNTYTSAVFSGERPATGHSQADQHSRLSLNDGLSPVEEVDLYLPGMSTMNITHQQKDTNKLSTDSAISHL